MKIKDKPKKLKSLRKQNKNIQSKIKKANEKNSI